MKIKVDIHPQYAIPAGIEPGRHDVEVDLALLSQADRDLLAAHVREYQEAYYLHDGTPSANNIGYAVRMPSVAGILDAIRRTDECIAENARKAAERKAADERELLAGIEKARPEIERLLAQGRLDITSYDGVRYAVQDANLGYVSAGLKRSGDWHRLESAAVAEKHRLQEAKEREIAAAKTAMLAKRDAWLTANGGETILAKIAAGYDCAGAVRALVRAQAVEKILALGESLRVLDEADECSDCRDRSCPSDAAFALEQAAQAAGFGAEVVWATWSAEATGDEEDSKAELVRIVVPCPWDEGQADYLTLEVTGKGFAD